jgi:hypothetical protein
LPVALERILVDRDDHRGRGGALARRDPLVGIEQFVPQPLPPRKVFGKARRDEKREKQHAERADAPDARFVRAAHGLEFTRRGSDVQTYTSITSPS